ncbi:hypothetical protein RRG08_012201 [Elysia crispata]|uniref:Uncharacterized protein n=1 Tax=Elysia crispata TaxID=231223 RepID=A0AAE1AK03_9GAST|nr:hypothetical protein RRG08_012201 [Elysia crispata]
MCLSSCWSCQQALATDRPFSTWTGPTNQLRPVSILLLELPTSSGHRPPLLHLDRTNKPAPPCVYPPVGAANKLWPQTAPSPPGLDQQTSSVLCLSSCWSCQQALATDRPFSTWTGPTNQLRPVSILLLELPTSSGHRPPLLHLDWANKPAPSCVYPPVGAANKLWPQTAPSPPGPSQQTSSVLCLSSCWSFQQALATDRPFSTWTGPTNQLRPVSILLLELPTSSGHRPPLLHLDWANKPAPSCVYPPVGAANKLWPQTAPSPPGLGQQTSSVLCLSSCWSCQQALATDRPFSTWTGPTNQLRPPGSHPGIEVGLAQFP